MANACHTRCLFFGVKYMRCSRKLGTPKNSPNSRFYRIQFNPIHTSNSTVSKPSLQLNQRWFPKAQAYATPATDDFHPQKKGWIVVAKEQQRQREASSIFFCRGQSDGFARTYSSESCCRRKGEIAPKPFTDEKYRQKFMVELMLY